MTVNHTSGGTIKGFFAQARRGPGTIVTSDNGSPVGTFKSSGQSHMKGLTCSAANVRTCNLDENKQYIFLIIFA